MFLYILISRWAFSVIIDFFLFPLSKSFSSLQHWQKIYRTLFLIDFKKRKLPVRYD